MSSYIQADVSEPESSVAMVCQNNVTINLKSQSKNRLCKVYKVRWAILCLFILYSAISTMQWIQYSIIADVIVKYYGISYDAANWTSLVFLLVYIPFLIPGSYVLHKLGLRNSVLLGMLGTCAGSWIKVASVAPDRFWVLLLGQSVVAISEVLIMPLPPKVAAVWFGPNEVSSACSIGLVGLQIGISLGFIIPPLVVNNQGNEKNVEQRLEIMAFSVAVACSIFLLILFGFFQERPPTPPSPAQLKIQEDANSISFTRSLKELFFDSSYILFVIAYGILTGIYYAISALLNQIILEYYPDASKDAGIIGLSITVAGMLGAIMFGLILDKFKCFKEATITTYLISLIAMLVFTFTLDKGLIAVYIGSIMLGYFLSGFNALAFEMSAELTYPVPEGTSGGLLTISAQILGIAITYLYSFLFYNVGHMWANLGMSALLLLGLTLLFFIRYNLKRQAAQDTTYIDKTIS